MPSIAEEDTAIVSLLTSALHDTAPYLRRESFPSLFPTRKPVVEWIKDYLSSYGTLPSLKALKQKFPGQNTLLRPLPFHDSLPPLVSGFVETVASNASEEMSKLLVAGSYKDFTEYARKMVTAIDGATRPVEADVCSDSTFIQDLSSAVAADSANWLKVMPTGIKPLDDTMGGGMRPGDIVVLASLINLGKTYVAVSVANSLRAAGKKVLFYSLEMPTKQIMLRLMAVRFKANADQLVTGIQPKTSVDSGENYETWYQGTLQGILSQQGTEDKKAGANKGEVFVVSTDGGAIDTARILTDLQDKKADVVIIDASQDLRDAKGTKDRTPALYNAVAEINAAANKHKVAVFLTVQLDSEVEKKGLAKGNLARIAWGQVFAQKATVVATMLGERDSGIRDIKIEKNRNGLVGKSFWLTLKFPMVEVSATTTPPGTLDDLDSKVKTADSLAELASLMDEVAIPTSSIQQPIKTPPRLPTPKSPTPVDPPATPPSAPSATSPSSSPALSPYEVRQQMKERAKKLRQVKSSRKV